jgi:hypothetical protein
MRHAGAVRLALLDSSVMRTFSHVHITHGIPTYDYSGTCTSSTITDRAPMRWPTALLTAFSSQIVGVDPRLVALRHMECIDVY